jgi:hypothetical protein
MLYSVRNTYVPKFRLSVLGSCVFPNRRPKRENSSLAWNLTQTHPKGTPQFPFLWFEDTFSSMQSTIWSRPINDPYLGCWNVSGGALTILPWDFPTCYVRPTFQYGAWRLPVAGRIYGASISLEGGGIPATSCCAFDVQLGVNSLNYRREISDAIGLGTNQGPCGSNLATCSRNYGDSCGGATGTFWEDWNIAGTYQSQSQRRLCYGDTCFCGAAANPIINSLPSANYTTVWIANSRPRTAGANKFLTFLYCRISFLVLTEPN